MARIPIIAGDSIELNFEGVFRISELRRNLTIDVRAHMFSLFVPDRHIHGQDFIDFIKQGVDETITFNGVNLGAEELFYVASGDATGTVPLTMVAGYNRIWNRYFRAPTDTASELSDTDFGTGEGNTKKYGRLCGREKRVWTTGIDATVDASDREVSAVTTLDILDLERTRARYRTEQQRDWFNQRYTDLLQDVYGGFANADADERPTLIARDSTWISGYDVDGTGDANLGTYAGKSAGQVRHGFRRKFFPEHGYLWVMALLRFPTIHEEEVHYLDKIPNPTYLQRSGDPQLYEAEPPIVHTVGDFFKGSSAVPLGTHPYGQWFREHPSYVHNDYDALDGFTFLADNPNSLEQARYHENGDYDSVFRTTQLAHWQTQGSFRITAHRVVPTVLQSIFAGATNS